MDIDTANAILDRLTLRIHGAKSIRLVTNWGGNDLAMIMVNIETDDARTPGQSFAAGWMSKPFNLALMTQTEELLWCVHRTLERWAQHEVLEGLLIDGNIPVWSPHVGRYGVYQTREETYFERRGWRSSDDSTDGVRSVATVGS